MVGSELNKTVDAKFAVIIHFRVDMFLKDEVSSGDALTCVAKLA